MENDGRKRPRFEVSVNEAGYMNPASSDDEAENEDQSPYQIGLKLHEDDPEEAENLYRTQLRFAPPNDPENVDCLHSLAHLLHHGFQEHWEAVQAFRACLALAPRHSGCITSLAGVLTDAFHDHATARQLYEAALKLSPGDTEARLFLALLLELKFCDYTASAEHLRTLFKMAPNDVDVNLLRALSLFRIGKTDSARSIANTLGGPPPIDMSSINDEWDLFCAVALWTMSEDQPPELQSQLLQVAARSDCTVNTLFYIGQWLKSRNQPQLALKSFIKCVEIDHGFGEAHLQLGLLARHHLFDHSLALSHFNRVLEINPNHLQAIQETADILAQQGDFIKSKELLDRAVSIAISNQQTDIHFNLEQQSNPFSN